MVGRDFSHALLAAVSEREEAPLRRELAGLMDAGLLWERGTDEPAYQFRHALIQDAAYQSLSRGTRRQYHQRISRVLVERFPRLVEAKPEVLAYHCTEAGEHARAIGYWEQGLFELRATMSLCRQLRDQGRGRGAWRLLSRARARFQAGGDSADLREAKALLEELAVQAPSPPG